jgi:hypothetical protein
VLRFDLNNLCNELKFDAAMVFSEQIYREISLSRYMTVQIPRGINEAIEDFLRTRQASRMGFNSKTELITEAVRNMLTQYGYYHELENKRKE